MLFFHEEVQLVQPPKYSAILLVVMRKRFSQTDKCKATFVFYGITHESFPKEGAKLRDGGERILEE
jgi:hypothetical protein